MSEDWLNKWYSKNFTDAPAPKPKADNWSEIDAKMNNWKAFWYTSNAEELNLDPKASTWDKIASDLNAISANRASVRLFWLRTSAATVGFFLLPFLLRDIQNNATVSTSSNNSIQQSQASVQPTQTAQLNDDPNRTAQRNSLVGKETVSAPTEKSRENPIQFQFKNVESIDLSSNGVQVSTDPDPTIETLVSVPVKHHFYWDSMVSLQVLPTNELLIARSAERMKQDPHSVISASPYWLFGVGFNIQRSNLYNPTTLKGMNSASLITNQLGTSVSVDVSLARQIGNQSYIQGMLTFNDSKRQKYLDFVGADYIEKQLNLTYQTLTISYNRALFSHKLKGRFGLDFNSGIHAGYLVKKQELWASEERLGLVEGFRNFNAGVDFSLNGIVKLNQRYDMTTGVYYSNGLINVFKGTADIPADFYRTYTSSFGLNVGLRMKL